MQLNVFDQLILSLSAIMPLLKQITGSTALSLAVGVGILSAFVGSAVVVDYLDTGEDEEWLKGFDRGENQV